MVIAVPVAVLLAVLASTSWFTHVINRSQDLGSQARQAMGVLDQVQSGVLGADDAVRGYLLSDDPSFLAEYSSEKASASSSFAQLSRLSSEPPSTASAYRKLGSATSKVLSDLSQLASTPAASRSSGSQSALMSASESDYRTFVGAVSALDGEYALTIAKQHSSLHSSNNYLLVITIVATVLALGAGIGLSQLFTSGVTRRLRNLERATLTMEEGGVPHDVPGGQDEIGRLSARVMTSASELRDRAEELDGARRQLEDILTASPVVSMRYDVESRRFSYASPNVARLLGVSPEEAVADPDSVIDRFHPEDARRLRDEMVAALRSSSERVETVLRFRRDPSSQRWGAAEAVYTFERDHEGGLLGVVSYFVDSSERHLAQRAADERRSMLESIFHASPDTIVVSDVAGRIIVGSTYAGIVGLTDDDLPADADGEGRASEVSRFADVSPADRKLLDSLTARCLAGEPTPDPVITSSRLPDGQVRTFETRARPVLDHTGRVTGTVTVSRDVTDRVHLEHSLRNASAEARRASQAKNDFLSRMSHELRTPLNAILGFAQLLELDELPEEQQSSIDQIERAGQHLLSLINEVLDISRIESGRLSLSLELVAVEGVLDEVTALLGPAAEAAGLQLTVASGPERDRLVHADRQRLLQVLLNLGSNALKYNERGGSVAFRTSQTSGDRIRFEVRDTGPGIPIEQQGQLFVPFSRLGAERSAVEGTGVGLALSKQLVELMGGAIGVESVPGHGSTFWVELLEAREEDALSDLAGGREEAEQSETERELNAGAVAFGATGTGNGTTPAADASSLEYASPVTSRNGDSEGRAARQGLVVLQIEDNASNATLVEQILARRPEVHLVSTPEGGLGLELAREYRPDLILLDLHLPDLPGDELLYRLRAVPELSDTKVVVVSADATPGRIRRMLDLGVEGYLTKPVDVEALLRLVDLEIAASFGGPG